MSKANLEERVAALEMAIAKLSQPQEKTELPWWHRVKGMFQDEKALDEALRLGREYRESLRPTKKVNRGKKAKSNGHSRH